MGSSLSTNKFPVQGRVCITMSLSFSSSSRTQLSFEMQADFSDCPDHRGLPGYWSRSCAAFGRERGECHDGGPRRKRLRDGVGSLKTAALSPETQRFQFVSADLTDAETCVQVMSQTTEWNSGLPPDVGWSFVGAGIPTPLRRDRRLATSSTDGHQLLRKRILSPRNIENVAKRRGRTGRRGDDKEEEDCHKTPYLHFFLPSSIFNGWIHVLWTCQGCHSISVRLSVTGTTPLCRNKSIMFSGPSSYGPSRHHSH